MRKQKRPLSYRGIAYTITKGPRATHFLRGRYQNGFPLSSSNSYDPLWHGRIEFPDTVEPVFNQRTKAELISFIEQAINIHFDYDGDFDFYYLVENLVRGLDGYVSRKNGARQKIVEPTVGEMRSLIERVCERAQKNVSAQYADAARAALIEKLRRMTTANGCTAAEADAAAQKLQQLMMLEEAK